MRRAATVRERLPRSCSEMIDPGRVLPMMVATMLRTPGQGPVARVDRPGQRDHRHLLAQRDRFRQPGPSGARNRRACTAASCVDRAGQGKLVVHGGGGHAGEPRMGPGVIGGGVAGLCDRRGRVRVGGHVDADHGRSRSPGTCAAAAAPAGVYAGSGPSSMVSAIALDASRCNTAAGPAGRPGRTGRDARRSRAAQAHGLPAGSAAASPPAEGLPQHWPQLACRPGWPGALRCLSPGGCGKGDQVPGGGVMWAKAGMMWELRPGRWCRPVRRRRQVSG